MANSCLSLNEINTPEFKEFRSHYSDYSDGFLLDAIVAYREKYRKDPIDSAVYYPTNPQQFSAFTTFIRRKYLSESRQKQNAEMTREELIDTYSAMSEAFTPRIRRYRTNMIAQDMLRVIRNILRGDSSLTVKQAIEKAGGYKKLITFNNEFHFNQLYLFH